MIFKLTNKGSIFFIKIPWDCVCVCVCVCVQTQLEGKTLYKIMKICYVNNKNNDQTFIIQAINRQFTFSHK